jgi:hypothetical protein
MVTYEITATVRADLCDAYEKYMTERHIPDVLDTGAFAGASFSRTAPGHYRIRYEAHSRVALDRYLKDSAQALRAHFTETFPDGVQLTRQEWDILATWP